MLVTACAPTFLNPVGHEKLSCTGSSLIVRFRPSPCPNHYDGHVATMPSADFGRLLLTSAESLHRLPSTALSVCILFAFFGRYTPKSQGTYSPEPHWLSTDLGECQISPDKNMIRPCATAPLTVAVRSHGFVVLCQLASSLRLI